MLYNEIVRRQLFRGKKVDVAGVVDYLVNNYIERTEDNIPADEVESGYYWQRVLLPNGTRLRMTIHGTQHFAEIKNNAVVYEGKRYTPSSWANHIAGHPRNAWRDIYVMRPGESEWKFSNTLRAK